MIKQIGGVLYEVRSPSLFQVRHAGDTVQVAYLGITLQYGVRLIRADGKETARAQMTREKAFGLVSQGFGINAEKSLPCS